MKKAISLKYQHNAPTVTAKGYDELAEKMLSEARIQGKLVHEDEQLMRWLENLDIGEEIPAEVYIVIAELISLSWYLEGKNPPGWEGVNALV
ncbi:EscU/YscU/HrcU family type III secretion system export apparatus switch protein [Thaumasiovibrio subtropicus]|uniref:EscU/YscU/HrcU family type III secretion system export apparatus switch protein n=1 Tax=Thaumasiovibrio subtropicus TaxID=1891207 RepID=UPI00192D1772|nr:EscU/YscU/HrcU family type III secretion system export apparatus switch protein [Thaumasiovibrio subtropicus]